MSARADLAAVNAHLKVLLDFGGLQAFEDIVTRYREAIHRFGHVRGPIPVTGVEMRPARIGGMAGEWVLAPGANTGRRLLYIHGGSLLCGSLDSHRALVAELAKSSGWAVLHIDYRLAPEHLFPAAHDDCLAASRWMAAHGPDGPSPASSTALAGESIGAALALAACAAEIEAGRRPDALVLFSGCLDSTPRPDRGESRDTDPVCNAAAVAALPVYAPDLPLDDPRLSPLFLPETTIAALPPTFIQASTAEFLLPDSLAMAQRLTGAGRRVVLSLWPDMPHIWQHFLDDLPEARAALAEAGRFLATA